MKNSNIKIYISCFNNKIKLPENSLFEIVQTGSANAPIRYEGVRHDDEGDNISVWNDQFNDASTLYWAWKNCENDYYGFFQYRRFLSFNQEMLEKEVFEWKCDTNDDDSFEKLHLNDESSMRKLIESYDVITCNPLQYDKDYYSLYQQYCDDPHEHEKDLKLLLSIIQEKYPEYMPAVRESLFKSPKGYFANCFIMKKEYFDQYCRFLFDVLLEFREKADTEDYSFTERRAPGFLSERMLGFFYAHLQMNTDCKITQLQKCFFRTTREQPIARAFEEQKTAIVLSVDRKGMPDCSATVQSILEHANPNCKYDIVLFHEDLSGYAIKRFCKVAQPGHISLRFVNISSYLVEKDLEKQSFEARQPRYCLVLADVLREYDRCVWIPKGSVVKRDLAEADQIQMGSQCLCVQTPLSADLLKLNEKIKTRTQKKKNNNVSALHLEYLTELFEAHLGQMMILAIPAIIAVEDGRYAIEDWFARTLGYSCGYAFVPQHIQSGEKMLEQFLTYEERDLEDYRGRCALARDYIVREKLRSYRKYFPEGEEWDEKLDCFVEDIPLPDCAIKPAFSERNVAIGLMCSEAYVKYTSITIQSVLEKASTQMNYDILVFHEGLSKKCKQKLLLGMESYPNVSLRFCMIRDTIKLITSNAQMQYSKLIYCRVLMGYLLTEYQQIVFVDSDMIVDTDLSVFFDYAFNGAFLAAAHEWCYEESYLEKVLKFKDGLKTTFNAGFMVMNLQKFRDTFTADQLLAMCSAQEWKYVDQDVLNILCLHQVEYLPYTWNYRVDYDSIGVLFINECLRGDTFMVGTPKIYHFAGAYKPWLLAGLKFEDKFWKLAERSLFYSEIIMTAVARPSYVMPNIEFRPNLIPLSHPSRKILDFFLPKGSKRRELVKAVVRIIHG